MLYSDSSDAWFSVAHPLHSPRASQQLKLRTERAQAAASSKVRFTPKRGPVLAGPAVAPSPARAAVVAPGPSPLRNVAKKLTFPSPAPAPAVVAEGSRKRRPESAVRVVGSGPFSEARQKKAARSLVLDDTDSLSQPDMVTAASMLPHQQQQPFDAAARRLLFQLSPSGHTLVTQPKKSAAAPAASPCAHNDIFAELEKLSISSDAKESNSKKRVLTSTPPRSVRLGGAPGRVAAGSNLQFGAEENAGPAPPAVVEEDSVRAKRGRTGPQIAVGASILSKMAPNKQAGSTASKRTGSGTGSARAAGGAMAAAPSHRAPTAATAAKARKPVSVADVVEWEKRTGRSWHKLSQADKAVECESIRNHENRYGN